MHHYVLFVENEKVGKRLGLGELHTETPIAKGETVKIPTSPINETYAYVVKDIEHILDPLDGTVGFIVNSHIGNRIILEPKK